MLREVEEPRLSKCLVFIIMKKYDSNLHSFTTMWAESFCLKDRDCLLLLMSNFEERRLIFRQDLTSLNIKISKKSPFV